MRKSCIKCQSQRLQWSESFRTTVLWSNCFCQKTMHTTRTLKDVPNRFLALYTESICNGQKMINSWMMFDYHVKSCDVNGSLEPLKHRFCQKSFAILHNAIYINSFPENSLKTFIPLLIKGSSQLSVWCSFNAFNFPCGVTNLLTSHESFNFFITCLKICMAILIRTEICWGRDYQIFM